MYLQKNDSTGTREPVSLQLALSISPRAPTDNYSAPMARRINPRALDDVDVAGGPVDEVNRRSARMPS